MLSSLFTQEENQNHRSVISLCLILIRQITHKPFLVVSADALAKRDVFRLPDPFAVITVDSEQTHTTSVIKKTLNPYWNEHFDVSVILFLKASCPSNFLRQTFSMVKDSSVVAVQIFDQRKFKRRDQGFLGVVNIQVSNHLDLELGGHGMFSSPGIAFPPLTTFSCRGSAIRVEEVQRQSGRPGQTDTLPLHQP